MEISIALLITLSRIVMTPCIVWCVMMHHWTWASFLFAVAVSTDFLDGFVARKYNQESRLGQLLDPVADKILIISLMYSLFGVHAAFNNGTIQVAIFGLFFIVKEIVLLVGAAMVYLRYNLFFKPTFFSRFISVSEMIIIFDVLVSRAVFGMHPCGLLPKSGNFECVYGVGIGLLLFLTMGLSCVLLLQYGVSVVLFLRKRS